MTLGVAFLPCPGFQVFTERAELRAWSHAATQRSSPALSDQSFISFHNIILPFVLRRRRGKKTLAANENKTETIGTRLHRFSLANLHVSTLRLTIMLNMHDLAPILVSKGLGIHCTLKRPAQPEWGDKNEYHDEGWRGLQDNCDSRRSRKGLTVLVVLQRTEVSTKVRKIHHFIHNSVVKSLPALA